MRSSLLASVLLLLVAGVASAGEDLASADGVARLRHELRVARLEVDVRKALNLHLHRLIDDLFSRLGQHEDLTAWNEKLRVDLGAEQERHAADVDLLQQEFAKTQQRMEEARMAAAHAERRLETIQKQIAQAHARLQAQKAHLQNAMDRAKAEAERRIELSKEVDRLKWNFVKGAPNDSVAGRLGDVPAAHWRRELTSENALRARVALSVLAVVPDPSPEGAAFVIHAASHHPELLDRATGSLVRIGAPAVEKLLAAARSGAVPAAWAMHVLGEMGGDAENALWWLVEASGGEGRDAAAARRAIERIGGARETSR